MYDAISEQPGDAAWHTPLAHRYNQMTSECSDCWVDEIGPLLGR